MIHSLRKIAGSINPVRARAKVLARENADMREALVKLRHAQGLTQLQLAEMMGVSQQAVHKMERYDSDPRLSTIERYANAVGAIVYHRVDVDRGQSVRIAQTSVWRASRSIRHNDVRVITVSGWRVLDGWQDADTRVPAEMVAIAV